jgi:N-acetylmuramoyl-L-alanine amidase
VLIEGGFMSNPVEAKKIYSAAWRKQVEDATIAWLKASSHDLGFAQATSTTPGA